MRRIVTIITVGVLALSALLSASLLQAYSAPLCWEAEFARGVTNKVFHVRKYVEDPSGVVSNNKVLEIPKVAKGEKVKADEVFYHVNVPETGTYYLWARCLWSTGCGHSFTLKMEGFPTSGWVLGGDATYDSLHWVTISDSGDNSGGKLRPLHLKKGQMKIMLATRQAGVMVDQFILTTDPKLLPAGVYKPTKGLLVAKD